MKSGHRAPLPLVTSNEVIDTILERYSDALGDSASAYRNHVYRGLNYQLRILGTGPSDLLALAWGVHDLGIWTEHTLDYLPPSLRLAEQLAGEFHVDDVQQLRLVIEFHHGFRRLADPLAESFRVADRTDVWGRWRGPMRAEDIDEASDRFPDCGFHPFLRRSLLAYAVRHPWRPFPMLRW